MCVGASATLALKNSVHTVILRVVSIAMICAWLKRENIAKKKKLTISIQFMFYHSLWVFLSMHALQVIETSRILIFFSLLIYDMEWHRLHISVICDTNIVCDVNGYVCQIWNNFTMRDDSTYKLTLTHTLMTENVPQLSIFNFECTYLQYAQM